jgi:TonB-dependent Receptor Plug Domain/TonB dependent receptor
MGGKSSAALRKAYGGPAESRAGRGFSMWWRIAVAALICVLVCAPSPSQTAPAELHLQVTDEDNHPLARAEVAARWGTNSDFTEYTDAAGEVQIGPIADTNVLLSVSKPGFFKIENNSVSLKPGPNETTFVLNHATELQQTVQAVSTAPQIDPDTTGRQVTVTQHEITNTPVTSSHDLQQNLVAMPNVLMDASGRLHIAGARQGQTEIMLDGFEVNDPSNTTFLPRLNVDAVQTATVETGGYGAQYAHAGAGLLILETASGDDKWRSGATNFIPGFNIQEGVHLGNWYPRAKFSGPIKKGRAWFSEALSVQHSFAVISGVPAGQNFQTSWAGDNLLRTEINVTPRNVLQSSFLVNRSSSPENGLGPFTPISTTTDVQARRYFVSLRDQIWFGGTLIELGGAADTGQYNSTPQGSATYMVTPSMTAGNYFEQIAQRTRRLQLVGDLTSRPLNFLGTHVISAGWNLDAEDFSQSANRSEIEFVNNDSTISDIATFSGNSAYHEANTQAGVYLQDAWRPVKQLVLSGGIRGDWDRLIQDALVEPRLAMNWLPASDDRMKFTMAWGEHYQPINLAIFGQAMDQQRTDTFYDPTGTIVVGAPVVTTFVIPRGTLSQPRSYNTTAEWDEKILKSTYIGAAFLLREGRDAYAWQLQPSGEFTLEGSREDRFTSGEFWVRRAFGETSEVMVDYTRSRATSNEVLDPSISALLFAAQQPGPLAWDAPNRLISRGWTPIPWGKILFSYFVEYHTGFPFSAINQEQQLVGPADSLRFPDYFSLNLGLEKQFRFHGRDWAIRGAAINITGRQNPIDVVNNVDAPNFGTFGGGKTRAFTARLRIVKQ